MKKRGNLFRDRKAQLTIFIIIGIIMLFSAFLYIYIKNYMQSDISLAEINAPHEVAPIRAMIENCMTKLGIEGLKKMGMKGGYIYPEQYGIRGNPMDPTEKNGVYLFPDSDILIPYWYHMVGSNCPSGRCSFEVSIPPLYRISESHMDPSMQAQLEKYIQDNMHECLGGDDLSRIRDIGFNVEEKGFLEAGVFFSDIEVIINLSWPLWFQKIGNLNEHDLDEFMIYIPGDIKNVYEHAVTITSQQKKNSFLEILARFLIFGYQGKDSSRLPPYADSDFSLSGSVTWTKSNVQHRIKNLLSTYIPMLQYYGSYSYKERRLQDDIFSNYIYNNLMTIPSKKEGLGRLNVDFMYLDVWEPYIELNCQGQSCKGESVTLFNFIPIGFQRYRFFYNLSFPVLVSVHDPYALDKEGFTLQFFLESNLRYNEPVAHNLSPPRQYGGNEQINLFCNENQRNSGNITINATDTRGQALEGVNVLYTCGSASCSFGETDKNGSIFTKFPICFDGIITSYKKGYMGGSEFFTSELNEDGYIKLELAKESKIKIDVQKKDYVMKEPYLMNNWQFHDYGTSLDEDEFAFIYIYRHDKTGESPYNMIIVVRGNDPDSGSLDLAPGSYSVEARIFSNKRYVIPEKEITVGEDTLFTSEETFTIPLVEFNSSLPIGELYYNFSITDDDLDDYDVLTFYVITPNLHHIPEEERTIEQLELFGRFKRYSDEHLDYLNHTFR